MNPTPEALGHYNRGVILSRAVYQQENKSEEDELAEKAIRAARDKRRREARKEA